MLQTQPVSHSSRLGRLPLPGMRIDVPHWMRGLTVAFSVLFLLLFVAVAWHRLHYPFEVDRMESGMLTSVWRLRQGYALYSPPSMEWAPFLYAPLFFYLSAAVTKLVGISYTALRLVSIAASLGSFGFIFALTYHETRHWQPALFASGLFASLYPFVFAWYDVGRVDSLALFFFLAGLWAIRRRFLSGAALLFWLAFLTKQTYLPLGFAIFLVEWQRPKRMLFGMLAYGALIVGSLVWLQRVTHGWFSYYAFGTAGVIRWSPHTAMMFPFADLFGPLPVACGFIVLAFGMTGVRWRGRDGSYFGIVTLLLVGAIWFVRAHEGANLNAVIPLYAWMAVLTGVSLHRLLTAIEMGATGKAPALIAAVWLLAVSQLMSHLYRPAEIPTGNLAARTAFLTALRQTPGDVWVVDHSYDAILAGKPLHADMDALDAVLGRKDPATLRGFEQLVGRQRLSAVVLDRVPEAYAPKGIFTASSFATVYKLRATVPGAGAAGDLDQPSFAFLPCDGKTPEAGLLHLQQEMVDRSGCSQP